MVTSYWSRTLGSVSANAVAMPDGPPPRMVIRVFSVAMTTPSPPEVWRSLPRGAAQGAVPSAYRVGQLASRASRTASESSEATKGSR